MHDRVQDQSLSILVVEDDWDTQFNLCDLLELDGHEVSGALSIADMRAREDPAAFDVILLDWTLADGTATDLLPYLLERAPGTAVIVVTAYAHLDAAVTALRHGATDYLLKPVNPDVLRAGLRRIVALNQARERALQSERLAAIGQAMATLSHESRNELGAIRMGLQFLETLVDENAEARDMVALLHQSQANLWRLFEDVRRYAAPIVLERQACDLRDVWRDVWESLAPGRPRDAALDEHFAGANLLCNADRLRMGQVFRNLMENALAACDGGARIEVHCRDTELAGEPALEIAIRDNGPGIPADQRLRLFEPFFTTKTAGTGLGLPVVHRIVESHGGCIGLGRAGPGAEFLIMLPRGTDRLARRRAPREKDAQPAADAVSAQPQAHCPSG